MVDPLRKETGDLITWDMKKTEALNKVLPQSSLSSTLATPPELQKKKAGAGRMQSCRRSGSSHLRKLKVHRPVVPNDMHPQIPRKLADEMSKPPYVRFEWLGRA